MSRRCGSLILAGLLLLMVGCKSPANSDASPAKSETKKISMERNKGKQDPASIKLVPGPMVAPLPALLEWLGSSNKMLRLPVVAVPPGSLNSRFSNAYYLGVETDQAETERVYLKMDDGAMGISLVDRVRDLSIEGPTVLWVEGHWGSLLDKLGTDPFVKVLAVRRVGRWSDDTAGGNATTRVFVVQ